jgi:hypothetical protein
MSGRLVDPFLTSLASYLFSRLLVHLNSMLRERQSLNTLQDFAFRVVLQPMISGIFRWIYFS